MKKWLFVLYSILSYLLFLVVFAYNVGFMSNLFVPKSIDSGIPSASSLAWLANLGLIALFGLVHSVMARQQFKRWWLRFVPSAMERSVYMMQSSLLLGLIMWQWQPLPQTVWVVDNWLVRGMLWSFFLLGVGVVLVSTFLIDHLAFVGLKQAMTGWGKRPFTPPTFKTPFLYKFVRHPMQMGILMVYWITPEMSVGHLLFAISMTIYILIGLYFEERDLLQTFGAEYEAYREATPKLLPRLHTKQEKLYSTINT